MSSFPLNTDSNPTPASPSTETQENQKLLSSEVAPDGNILSKYLDRGTCDEEETNDVLLAGATPPAEAFDRFMGISLSKENKEDEHGNSLHLALFKTEGAAADAGQAMLEASMRSFPINTDSNLTPVSPSTETQENQNLPSSEIAPNGKNLSKYLDSGTYCNEDEAVDPMVAGATPATEVFDRFMALTVSRENKEDEHLNSPHLALSLGTNIISHELSNINTYAEHTTGASCVVTPTLSSPEMSDTSTNHKIPSNGEKKVASACATDAFDQSASATDAFDRLMALSLLKEEEEEDDVDRPLHLTLSLEKEADSDESPNIRVITAGDAPYDLAKSFEDINLSEDLLRGLYSEMKFEKPSQIQAKTLPMILNPPHCDLIAQAHSGSGKTTCFVLGMLSRVDPSLKAPQAICVCPTRELAIQNQEVLMKMGKFTGITSICAVRSDGRDYARRRHVIEQVVIGTPGTVKRWVTYKDLNTKDVKILVFDEADHMLAEEGFRDDSVRIHRDITRNRGGCQILLFSATFDERVKKFAQSIVRNANQLFLNKEELSLDVIKQYRVKCPDSTSKVILLRDTVFPAAEKLGQTIIFVRTRASASELHRILEADGYKCTSIHGGLDNDLRDQVIREFRLEQTKILISTDVLARGFDQAQVTMVVNFDVPSKPQSSEPDYDLYLHRIGRSGRFGRKGAAFNLLVTREDEESLDKIERYFNRHIIEVPWDNENAFETVLKEAGLA